MAKITCLAMLAAAVVAMVVLSSGPHWAQAQGQVCKGDIAALTTQCGQYVGKGGSKTTPSQGCCRVVKETDVQCVCEHIPPGAGAAIDLDKVFYICQTCGNPIKPGSKCGIEEKILTDTREMLAWFGG